MTKSDKILLAIHYEWSENWDVIEETLGKEIASSIEKELPRILKEEKEETEVLKELEWRD